MIFLPVALFTIENDSDREFMHELYARHHVIMMRAARGVTASQADAEDVVSDACVVLIKKISVLRQFDCNVLEGYIISTVKNVAFALHRKRKGRKETFGEPAEMEAYASDGQTTEEQALYRCSISTLTKAIGQLREEDQLVIRMKYFQKSSAREIAAVLGVQEVSVRSRLARARRRVLERMEALENGQE